MDRNNVTTLSSSFINWREVPLATFFTAKEVADYLLVSPRTVRRWIDREQLAMHRFGGPIRISKFDLAIFVDQARRGPPAPRANGPLDDGFYTAEAVAELLGVCIKTVRRRLDSEVLAAHYFGGLIRIARSDLQDFISRSRCE